jgi:hypothetical protein
MKNKNFIFTTILIIISLFFIYQFVNAAEETVKNELPPQEGIEYTAIPAQELSRLKEYISFHSNSDNGKRLTEDSIVFEKRRVATYRLATFFDNETKVRLLLIPMFYNDNSEGGVVSLKIDDSDTTIPLFGGSISPNCIQVEPQCIRLTLIDLVKRINSTLSEKMSNMNYKLEAFRIEDNRFSINEAQHKGSNICGICVYSLKGKPLGWSFASLILD